MKHPTATHKSALPSDYQNTILTIKQRIDKARYQSLQAVNSELILLYLDIGKVVSEKVSTGWGEAVVDRLAADLQAEFPGVKGFSLRNIRRMKFVHERCTQFSILPQAVAKLAWGHIDLIFTKIKELDAISFYLQKSSERGWSRAILEEEIRFDAYSKAVLFQNNFPQTIESEKLIDYRLEFRDEYDLSFLELADNHSERELENAIVRNITQTLGRFGSDFAFMGRQFRLELDEVEYFIDLLFYHRKLKCMVAIELKTTSFKPEHSQQLNWYLHLLDKTVKYADDNPSIGILLCKSKSSLTVEYALELVNRPLGVASYNYSQLPIEIAKCLPSEAELLQLFENQ